MICDAAQATKLFLCKPWNRTCLLPAALDTAKQEALVMVIIFIVLLCGMSKSSIPWLTSTASSASMNAMHELVLHRYQ